LHHFHKNRKYSYKPEIEFEYLAADVWIETDSEGNKTVAYTEDVKWEDVKLKLREHQKINYPILWDGHPARP
jgi:hypothetical protein